MNIVHDNIRSIKIVYKKKIWYLKNKKKKYKFETLGTAQGIEQDQIQTHHTHTHIDLHTGKNLLAYPR